MARIAVFLPNWLGDVVMATPALRGLRQHFGAGSHIVGIMRPYLSAVLAGTDWLDEQWYYDRRGKDRAMGAWAIVERMRRERFDLAVLFPNSLSSALVAWWGGVKERIGHARYGRGPLLTRRVAVPRVDGRPQPCPMVDYYLMLAEAAGCGTLSRRLELATTAADECSADAVWRNLELRRDGRVVALNCSGAYGSAKLWPVEYFAALARRVVEELDYDVLVMCGPAERDTAREIVRQADSRFVVSMADEALDLGTAKACIARTRLMVSTDSGPRHVAAGLGRPVVTMYGPMLPVWSENPTVRAANLVLDLDCVGCHKRECPLGHHQCMRGLTVERVFAAARPYLIHEHAGAA